MATDENAFLASTNLVGTPVDIGTSKERYDGFLAPGEQVEMEFKGLRDAAVFTNLRLIVIDPQGITGRKVALNSFPWRSISAFSVENSGRFDYDTELKVCGSGFGTCKINFFKGVDVKVIAQYINGKVFK